MAISSLPDDVLLEIFNVYRMDEVATSSHLPWKWYGLVHVCQSWRSIIFSSTHHLNLELLCTHGTPVRKNLGCLPALPIVIHFPGSYRDSDEDNIIAALEHPDRVRVVELRVPCSLSRKMVTVMQGPFPALTRLSLEWTKVGPKPVLPDAFLGGSAPSLQQIYLNGIYFSAALIPLLSARDIVDVDLRDISDTIDVDLRDEDISDTSYTSPEATVASLAALSRLKYLTLGFRWADTFFPDRISQSPTTRTVLPALTRLCFVGCFGYLELFAAQIDAPQLDCLEIEFLEYWDEEEIADYRIFQLCKFVDRSEKLKLSSFRRMNLHIQSNTVTIELLHGGQSSFKLSIQDEGINQVLIQICGMLSNVDRLFIGSGDTTYFGELGDDILWLQLLRPFTAVKALTVQAELSHHVALALKYVTGEKAAEVLPALESLCLQGWPMVYLEKFLAARRTVGLPVTLIDKELELQE